jgi:hypothetical protein
VRRSELRQQHQDQRILFGMAQPRQIGGWNTRRLESTRP